MKMDVSDFNLSSSEETKVIGTAIIKLPNDYIIEKKCIRCIMNTDSDFVKIETLDGFIYYTSIVNVVLIIDKNDKQE